jgi:Tol biopolymer transport system component/predicted Ser/Thr protein kinase
MTLAAGTRLGPYEILSPLGAGGMGEVYKARDTRLDRAVAVKVLPSHMSSSPEARRRLEREAKTISKLSHPHICALYDVGHQDGTDFLVMELLEGETLSDRLARGPLPPEQTVRCGIEIADALDRAHRQGIVHRDLKPGNVMLTNSGVKLLDFGLAKAFAPLFPGSEANGLLTVSTPVDLTREGAVVGTFQYMAPEQVEGKAADPRSDIFAFGVVLYEMATGRRAFTGSSRAALAAAILASEPPSMASVQPLIPSALERLIRVCLAKDPERRWQTAHDIGLQLAAMGESGSWTGARVEPLPARRVTRWTPWAVAVVAGAVALGALLRPSVRPDTVPLAIRFSVPPPPGGAFLLSYVETVTLALTPDGSQIGFIAWDPAGGTRVWLRPLAAVEARPLAGTEGATSLFWSPDGRSIAFFADGKLKRLDLPGGAALPLCDVPEGIGLYGSWGSDGQILFAPVDGEAIFRVATTGGTPTAVIKPDASRGETGVKWPWFLPDGRRFFYVAGASDWSRRLMLAEPGKPPRPVMPIASNVQWVEPDYLVYVRDGTIVGQHLDLSNGRLVGDPFSIAEPVNYFFHTGRVEFSTSRNGILAYQSHSNRARLVWVDRSGREIATVGASADFVRMNLSPDGREVAVDRGDPRPGTFHLWAYDLERSVETRLTSGRGNEFGPVWLPDGSAVVYSGADTSGTAHLFSKDLATGAEKELLPRTEFQLASDVSPDGRFVAFLQRGQHGGNTDLWTLPLAGERKPLPLIRSPFNEAGARFSPDGRYVAYASDESGSDEAYVAPFPTTGAKTRVSTGGGRLPHWSRDGHELFYLSDDGHLVSAPVRLAQSLEIGTPMPLFALRENTSWTDFDVSPDGKKFLAIVPEVVGDAQPLTVVMNWTAGIGR